MILFFGSGFPPQISTKIATLGRIGYWGKAPGTNGSFVGLIWYTLLFHDLSPFFYLLLCFLTVQTAIGVCTQAERVLGEKDPSCVIIDEMVAVPICFLGLQPYMYRYPVWWFMLIGFLLFRLFDVLKPFGIKKLQELPGGQGVVIDDVAAAAATCLCLHVLAQVFLR